MKEIIRRFSAVILSIGAFGALLAADEPKKDHGMDDGQLASAIREFLLPAYPEIVVVVRPWKDDPSRRAITFVEKKFAVLYPMQRYHYLVHLIPKEFFSRHLKTSVWFELAPGETEDDLHYPDEELIKRISPDVMRALNGAGVFEALDELMAPIDESKAGLECHGDFQLTKKVLVQKGFGARKSVDEVFDVCHVLMASGGYCDCEVLTNVAELSRMKERYWKSVAEKAQPGATDNPDGAQ